MLQLARTESGLFLELAVGGGEHLFARLDQSLGQGQLVVVGAGAVLLHQQHMLGIGHGHHHHRAVTGALAHQTLVSALNAIGESQLQLLDTEQAAAGDYLASEHRGLLTHNGLLGMTGGLSYPAFAQCPRRRLHASDDQRCIGDTSSKSTDSAHAPTALDRDRHRAARHGRHPARPALR
ncbi:hypothetical protein D3C76_1369060 [compost metagenome]